MTKNELVAEVARRTGATRKEVTDMMESVNEVVMDQVKKGEPVYFRQDEIRQKINLDIPTKRKG